MRSPHRWLCFRICLWQKPLGHGRLIVPSWNWWGWLQVRHFPSALWSWVPVSCLQLLKRFWSQVGRKTILPWPNTGAALLAVFTCIPGSPKVSGEHSPWWCGQLSDCGLTLARVCASWSTPSQWVGPGPEERERKPSRYIYGAWSGCTSYAPSICRKKVQQKCNIYLKTRSQDQGQNDVK